MLNKMVVAYEGDTELFDQSKTQKYSAKQDFRPFSSSTKIFAEEGIVNFFLGQRQTEAWCKTSECSGFLLQLANMPVRATVGKNHFFHTFYREAIVLFYKDHDIYNV